MRRELLSVVKGDGVHEVADWLEAKHGCPLCCVGGRTRQLDDFGQLGFALDQREQAALVSGTDNGIALPDSQTGFAREDPNFYPPKKECLLRSAAVAEQPQQHQEQVDEVEIEPQRAHDRLAAGDGAVVHRAVHLLDVLRVVGGEPDEHEHAND